MPPPMTARRMGSVFQRQGDGFAVTRREIGGDQHFKRLEAFAAVSFGFGFALQDIDDIFVIEGMTETIDGGGFVVGILDGLVVIALVGEFPLLNVVDG